MVCRVQSLDFQGSFPVTRFRTPPNPSRGSGMNVGQGTRPDSLRTLEKKKTFLVSPEPCLCTERESIINFLCVLDSGETFNTLTFREIKYYKVEDMVSVSMFTSGTTRGPL